MVEIVVDAEQATRINDRETLISLVDGNGRLLGRFTRLSESSRFSSDELASLEERLDDDVPRRPMREIVSELRERSAT